MRSITFRLTLFLFLLLGLLIGSLVEYHFEELDMELLVAGKVAPPNPARDATRAI